jgi:transcriptional regulator with XRE-family HTH domain
MGGVKMTELKKARIRKGLQQTFVAESCGLKQYNLGRYENNGKTPGLKIAVRLAEFYGIKTVEELKKLFELK